MKYDTFDQFQEKAFCLWIVTTTKKSTSGKIQIIPVKKFMMARSRGM